MVWIASPARFQTKNAAAVYVLALAGLRGQRRSYLRSVSMPREIPLSQGRVAIVDDDDFERVSQHKWTVMKTKRRFYAFRQIWARHKNELMHRFILLAPAGVQVDHINGDGLDNRRSNLRLCSNAENSRNQLKRRGTSSQYKGVYWNKSRRTWTAQIKVNYQVHYLGCFAIEKEAHDAYCAASAKYHGDFGRTA